jgi:hypothetical protein
MSCTVQCTLYSTVYGRVNIFWRRKSERFVLNLGLTLNQPEFIQDFLLHKKWFLFYSLLRRLNIFSYSDPQFFSDWDTDSDTDSNANVFWPKFYIFMNNDREWSCAP